MPLTITDEDLARIDLSPAQLRLEIAVMLREKDKLDWRPAARLAGVDLGTFLDVLKERGVPFVHAGGTTPEEAAEYVRQEAGWSERLAELRAASAADFPAAGSPAADVSAERPAGRAAA